MSYEDRVLKLEAKRLREAMEKKDGQAQAKKMKAAATKAKKEETMKAAAGQPASCQSKCGACQNLLYCTLTYSNSLSSRRVKYCQGEGERT